MGKNPKKTNKADKSTGVRRRQQSSNLPRFEEREERRAKMKAKVFAEEYISQMMQAMPQVLGSKTPSAINYNSEQMREIGRTLTNHIAWEQMYTSILSLLVAKEARDAQELTYGRIEQLAEIAVTASDISVQPLLERRRKVEEDADALRQMSDARQTHGEREGYPR